MSQDPLRTNQLRMEVYALYRDYIKHEDSLIRDRITWNLTIQGFLFAAYALVLQTHLSPNQPITDWWVEIFLVMVHSVVIPVVGYVLARESQGAVAAATAAIHNLELSHNAFEAQFSQDDLRQHPSLPLPLVTRGGIPEVDRGHAYTLYVPSVVMAAWVAVALWWHALFTLPTLFWRAMALSVALASASQP